MNIMNNIRNYIENSDFKIHIYGNKLNIVNYTSLLKIEENEISVKYKNGVIDVKGKNLSIIKLLDDELLINGEFKSVEFR